MIPKYKINDQVIVSTNNDNTTFSLGIVQFADFPSDEWVYTVKIKSAQASYKESKIKGVVYESKDLTDILKEQEESIIL